MTRKAMLARMARNLAGSAGRVDDEGGQLRHYDALLVIDPESGVERGARAMLRARAGDFTGALADIDMLIENPPEGVDVDKLAALRRRLAEQAERGSR
jgi:regulator of sirC expression with transglutaminase-like and TPR domain